MANEKPSKFFYGYWVVAVSMITILLTFGVRTSIGNFIVPWQNVAQQGGFGWSKTLISGAITLSILVQGILGIPLGRWVDKIGARWIMTICSVFLGVGILLMYWMQTSWEYYVLYGLVVGIGCSGAFVAVTATVSRWFHRRRGAMTGIALLGIGLGGVIFNEATAALNNAYGWRTCLLIVGIIVVVVGVAVAQFFRRDPHEMGLLPDGDVREGGMPFQTWGLTVKGAIATWQFWVLSLFFFCAGFTLFVVVNHMIPQIIQIGFAIDNQTGYNYITTSASVMAVFVALQAVGSIVFGALIDKIGSKTVQAISFILLAVALFWLAYVGKLSGFWPVAAIAGFAIGGTAATQSTKAVELFGVRSVGTLMGLLTLMYCIGGAVGPVVTAAMQDAGKTLNSQHWAVYPYRGTWILTGIIAVVGLLAVLALRPVKNPEVVPPWLRHKAAAQVVVEELPLVGEGTEA